MRISIALAPAGLRQTMEVAMRKTIGAFCGAVALGCGAYLWWMQTSALVDWVGFFGWILTILLMPAIPFFPLVFWVVEGVFPVSYFVVEVIGLVAIGLAAWLFEI